MAAFTQPVSAELFHDFQVAASDRGALYSAVAELDLGYGSLLAVGAQDFNGDAKLTVAQIALKPAPWATFKAGRIGIPFGLTSPATGAYYALPDEPTAPRQFQAIRSSLGVPDLGIGLDLTAGPVTLSMSQYKPQKDTTVTQALLFQDILPDLPVQVGPVRALLGQLHLLPAVQHQTVHTELTSFTQAGIEYAVDGATLVANGLRLRSSTDAATVYVVGAQKAIGLWDVSGEYLGYSGGGGAEITLQRQFEGFSAYGMASRFPDLDGREAAVGVLTRWKAVHLRLGLEQIRSRILGDDSRISAAAGFRF